MPISDILILLEDGHRSLLIYVDRAGYKNPHILRLTAIREERHASLKLFEAESHPSAAELGEGRRRVLTDGRPRPSRSGLSTYTLDSRKRALGLRNDVPS